MSFRSLIYSTLTAQSFKKPRLFLPGQENDAAANLITSGEEVGSLTPIGKYRRRAKAEPLLTLGDVQAPKPEPEASGFLALVDGVVPFLELPWSPLAKRKAESASAAPNALILSAGGVGLSHRSAASLILQSWGLWHVAGLGWSGYISVWLGGG